jgi:hypothetical protein
MNTSGRAYHQHFQISSKIEFEGGVYGDRWTGGGKGDRFFGIFMFHIFTTVMRN